MMVMKTLDELKQDGHIGIIGGNGRMGQWGLNLLHVLGYKNLHSFDVSGTNSVGGVREHSSAKDLAEVVDMLIVSVPPGITVDVIRDVGQYLREGALFSDFTSKKEASTAAMAEFSQVDVIGIHPMFNDTVKDLRGQNIAITPVEGRSENWLETIVSMYRETPANIRVVSPRVHDVVTDFNQAAIHAIYLIVGGLMRQYCKQQGIEPSDLFYLDTPNSRVMQLFLGRFYGTRNPAVAWGIQNGPYAQQIRTMLVEEALKIGRIVGGGDTGSFNSYFFRNASALGNGNLDVATKDSARIVGLLRELGYEANFQAVVEETKGFLDTTHRKASDLGMLAYFYRDPFRPLEEQGTPKESYVKEMAVAGTLYIRMEDQFRKGDYGDSRKTAVELRHNLIKKVTTQVERFDRGKAPLLQGIVEDVSRYIGMCDKVISYQRSITPTITK